MAVLEAALGGTARRSEGLMLYGRALALQNDAAGAERILTLHTPPLEWTAGRPFEAFRDGIRGRGVGPNRVLIFSAHQMASCRIGDDPRTTVADADGRDCAFGLEDGDGRGRVLRYRASG